MKLKKSETIAHKKRTTPASNAWVPAAAGLIIGGEVVKDLCRAAETLTESECERLNTIKNKRKKTTGLNFSFKC